MNPDLDLSDSAGSKLPFIFLCHSDFFNTWSQMHIKNNSSSLMFLYDYLFFMQYI